MSDIQSPSKKKTAMNEGREVYNGPKWFDIRNQDALYPSDSSLLESAVAAATTPSSSSIVLPVINNQPLTAGLSSPSAVSRGEGKGKKRIMFINTGNKVEAGHTMDEDGGNTNESLSDMSGGGKQSLQSPIPLPISYINKKARMEVELSLEGNVSSPLSSARSGPTTKEMESVLTFHVRSNNE